MLEPVAFVSSSSSSALTCPAGQLLGSETSCLFARWKKRKRKEKEGRKKSHRQKIKVVAKVQYSFVL